MARPVDGEEQIRAPAVGQRSRVDVAARLSVPTRHDAPVPERAGGLGGRGDREAVHVVPPPPRAVVEEVAAPGGMHARRPQVAVRPPRLPAQRVTDRLPPAQVGRAQHGERLAASLPAGRGRVRVVGPAHAQHHRIGEVAREHRQAGRNQRRPGGVTARDRRAVRARRHGLRCRSRARRLLLGLLARQARERNGQQRRAAPGRARPQPRSGPEDEPSSRATRSASVHAMGDADAGKSSSSYRAGRKRATGIEPVLRAWKALMQPLHHARVGWR